ncbi:recombinase family protein [Metabacillus litoralis]|uniref:recombinase family protein n=1 Tax=Metabacillus litoralis TaxID=152268 RepID=UPI001B8F4077|nr:recombinase family protein [Metabacillus litoralis]UHA60705.1 recombinase family protein [Metabacillus litoralis]
MQKLCKRIYKEYIAGKSFDAIGRSLFNEGIPTPAQEKGHKNANVLQSQLISFPYIQWFVSF